MTFPSTSRRPLDPANPLEPREIVVDSYYQAALDPENGEFLLQVVGVLDNPLGD